MMGGFPQRTARRGSWEQTLETKPYRNEQSQSLGRVSAGIRWRCLLSTAWRPPTKASAEKKKALTDLVFTPL